MTDRNTVRNFLSTNDGVADADSFERATDAGDPPVIPGYQIEKKIAEGGMGTVWLATESTEVQRKVAIKVIRKGLGNDDVTARFNVERQALAIMSHPNIAKILGAGSTRDGSPYFAMEFVDGIPITEFCQHRELGLRVRLELFVEVCSAVQHAHRVGVIHRDLKPSNVLVMNEDGRNICKIIDFGLAKPLGSRGELKNRVETQQGQVVGTLQYMSPEQADLDQNFIDTRTDVFALGTMLYELLTGSTPIQRETILNHSSFEILQMIREQEADRPSARMDRKGSHSLPDSQLRTALKRDLDWIVLKALEKKRERRYQGVSEFASDIRRYLNGDPVDARPPSIRYRLNKLVNKHRTASVIFFAVLLGLVITSTLVAGLYREKLAGLQLQNEIQSEKTKLQGLRRSLSINRLRIEVERANWDAVIVQADEFSHRWKGDHPDVLLCKVQALNGLERNRDALVVLRNLSENETLSPAQRAQVLLWQGDLQLLSRDQSTQAIRQIDEAISLGLEGQDRKYAQALLQVYRHGDLPRSNELFRQLITENPFHERANIGLISNLFLQGRYPECRRAISSAQNVFGKDEPRLLIIRVMMMLAEGKTKQARADLEKLRAIVGPGGAEAVERTGSLFFAMNESVSTLSISSQARALLNQYLKPSSSNEEIHLEAVVHGTEQPAFRAFIDCMTSLADFNLMLALKLRNDPLPLRAALEKGYQKYPDGMFQCFLGATFLLRGHTDFQQAGFHFQKALEDDSVCIGVKQYASYAATMCLLGQSIGKPDGKETEKAFEIAAQIIEREDDINAVHAGQIANAANDLERHSIAEKLSRLALRYHPNDGNLLSILLVSLQKQDRLGEAHDLCLEIQQRLNDGSLKYDDARMQQFRQLKSEINNALNEAIKKPDS